MKDSNDNKVINILRDVKELKVGNKLVRKYNPKEENHEVFYQLNNDFMDERTYQNLSDKEKEKVEAINIMSTWKKSDLHPTVAVTSAVNIYLIQMLGLNLEEVINEMVGAVRMVDIIELAEAFNFELGMNIPFKPESVIDITNLVPEIQARIKGEFPEFLQATELLYGREKMSTLITYNQKNITGKRGETNKFILKDLEESIPTRVYVYADKDDRGKDNITLDVVTTSDLWSMKMTRNNETKETTDPKFMYGKYLEQNETVRLVKTLYYLASIASLEGEQVMNQLPNILKFF